ncbi:hypothetical protein D9M71_424790 [compost metagenome]
MYTAAQKRLQMAGLQAREHRHDGQVDRLARVLVAQLGGNRRSPLTVTMARQRGKGIERLAAQLRRPAAMQQLTVEVQLHAIVQAAFELAQRAAQVAPGIAVCGACRQHRAGQQHRHRQAQQQERQCRGAVGQAVGAMQH